MVSPVTDDDKTALLARCRLAEARRWFGHLGWQTLPQSVRGQRILRWGADHAWLASPANPKRSVRRWCRKYQPRLTDADLDELVAYTEHSNKRWNADQCAIVLGVSVTDRTQLNLRHIGANDDPNYEIRLGIESANSAKRSRKYRAKHSTGGKRGRPALQLSEEERLARTRAQAAERQKRCRASRKNASRHISNNIDGVTEFSVTDFQSHVVQPVFVPPHLFVPAPLERTAIAGTG
jgi:hypothetical protein